jgi:hypothetical protein
MYASKWDHVIYPSNVDTNMHTFNDNSMHAIIMLYIPFNVDTNMHTFNGIIACSPPMADNSIHTSNADNSMYASKWYMLYIHPVEILACTPPMGTIACMFPNGITSHIHPVGILACMLPNRIMLYIHPVKILACFQIGSYYINPVGILACFQIGSCYISIQWGY